MRRSRGELAFLRRLDVAGFLVVVFLCLVELAALAEGVWLLDDWAAAGWTNGAKSPQHPATIRTKNSCQR
jgi:hypothetical protein